MSKKPSEIIIENTMKKSQVPGGCYVDPYYVMIDSILEYLDEQEKKNG